MILSFDMVAFFLKREGKGGTVGEYTIVAS